MHPLCLSSGSAPAPNPPGGDASRYIRALAASRGPAAMGRAKSTHARATYPPSGGGLSLSGWKAGKEPRRVALTRRRVRTTAVGTPHRRSTLQREKTSLLFSSRPRGPDGNASDDAGGAGVELLPALQRRRRSRVAARHCSVEELGDPTVRVLGGGRSVSHFGPRVFSDAAFISISLVFATAKYPRACRPTPRNGWVKTAPTTAGGNPATSGPLPRAAAGFP
ncbi:uncharacterized protein Tco025E_09741 [Trypanosoma conorhini]|uniref:Uncharacterized protein n=1 Tax=Trypanosoma conorhini TaxID=83891 RepID=A0A3R7LFQ2_9TRYP|nr:uncharacterized protein Tco025E_09741 [Trypanosoma conorhini]RNE96383.1 hypothetical protein Tco025E_09741 [Trypanosoma conorhini]